MSIIDSFLRGIANRIAAYLTSPSPGYRPHSTFNPRLLSQTLNPCDVILVEGNLRISTAIKYLTQSTWSHAALYVGNIFGDQAAEDPLVLVEADFTTGISTARLSKYEGCHVRICRPVGLSEKDRGTVIHHIVSRMGAAYDLKNILDLARYLFPTPPVPIRYRRKLISLGSGEPTKAICSSSIAEAFQAVRYPILPIKQEKSLDEIRMSPFASDSFKMRHHSLFVPRDFDISPFFEIVKPTIVHGFDFKAMNWSDH